MKLSEYIKSLRPSFLAKIRGKSIYDSTRDKRSLIRQAEKLEKALSSQGKIVFIENKEND